MILTMGVVEHYILAFPSLARYFGLKCYILNAFFTPHKNELNFYVLFFTPSTAPNLKIEWIVIFFIIIVGIFLVEWWKFVWFRLMSFGHEKMKLMEFTVGVWVDVDMEKGEMLMKEFWDEKVFWFFTDFHLFKCMCGKMIIFMYFTAYFTYIP